MKLSEWLTEKRWHGKDFAKMVGISEALVTLLKKGQRFPSPEVLERITITTSGAVTAEDFERVGRVMTKVRPPPIQAPP